MPIDRMSYSRAGGYGHSFAEKHQRTPEYTTPGASSASSSSWKTIETLRSLPKDFPTSAVSQNHLDKPIGLLQRKIELQDKGRPTENVDKAYKESMNTLYQKNSTAQSQAADETTRNRLINRSDKILETNKDTPFL
ncbi:hypothetical protein IFT37_11095 [Pseudomonas fluorescens]|uniref:hypothetical protein n=1 Tax=Pseudomonas fluorescens group TaxID=136843 RepID=UPI0015E70999|nr:MULTISPECIES: hypothetical protein [Pseudomonas fluorescens group]MBA1428551.1 hypothetical protein [Pseudomonas orientalis]MBD8150726.1 hypothetical protein [Pseudomonas fluorescens]MBD8176785.1 hypothetical protein [Pseudomonas fluorescens]MBD8745643.1 hypothetical protein [Pseudomonas fluorescens]MBD8749430.1 hypothetical protein [Pseudomonas fluorescens]